MSTTGKNIFIDWNDNFFHGGFLNGWLAYFAKNNHLWLLNQKIGESDKVINLLEATTLPSDFYLLTHTSTLAQVTGISAKKTWENKNFPLWVINGNKWALLYSSGDFSQLEKINNKQSYSCDQNNPLQILTGNNGTFTLQINIFNLPQNKTTKLQIKINTKVFKTLTLHNSNQQLILSLPIIKGQNIIAMGMFTNKNRPLPNHMGMCEIQKLKFL
jgi:hypothetical protein